MRKKKIGVKHFGPLIDITDPCYDRNVWCRMNGVNIKEGDYTCRIWKHSEKMKFNGKAYTDTRVGIIGIYLDDRIPKDKDFEKIGIICVDAGLAGFFTDKPDYTDEQWMELCNNLGTEDVWIRPEGFFSSSGYGDGSYPVLAAKDPKGEIFALEIRFL